MHPLRLALLPPMSFHPFFPDDAPDPADHHHHHPQHLAPPVAYQTYAPRLSRPQSQVTIGNVQMAASAAYPAHPQHGLDYLQSTSSQAFFPLPTALNHPPNSVPSIPDSSQHSYIHTSKIDHPALYPQSPTFTRYPPSSASSYVHYPPASYVSSIPSYSTPDPYQPVEDLVLIYPDETLPPDIKEEPSTPTSPQFIFEFPGGEPPDDDPVPPFDLSASEPPTLFEDSPCGARPASPATEEMKSMMSVFRVDPFASYDADAGGPARRRRRKRASTYARLTDPESSARETPLMFTFQLDVVGAPGWGFDDLDDDDEERLRMLEAKEGSSSFPPEDFSGTTTCGDSCGVFDHVSLLPSSSAFHPTADSASTSSLDAGGCLPYHHPHADSRLTSPAPSPLPPSSPRPPRPTAAAAAKTHVCWICQKEFPRPSGLATHMHTHSGEKPFRCPVPACSKPFAVRSNARRHLRTHTSQELASAMPPAAAADLAAAAASPSPSPPLFGGGGGGGGYDLNKCDDYAIQFGGGNARGVVAVVVGRPGPGPGPGPGHHPFVVEAC